MKVLVTEREIKKLISKGEKEIILDNDCILTPLAKDLINHNKIKIVAEKKEQSSVKCSFKKIAVGSDHTGVKAKKIVLELLNKKDFEVIDVGTFTEEAVDYPDIAYNVANRVKVGEVDAGIILDATGIPSAITANKLPGIRAATCYNEFSAKSSREHNDANVLVLGAKALGDESIKSICEVWLKSAFLGDRHQRRLDKIIVIEEKLLKK